MRHTRWIVLGLGGVLGLPGERPTQKSRPPTSGTHSPTWVQTHGMLDPGPPTGVYNLEHGTVVTRLSEVVRPTNVRRQRTTPSDLAEDRIRTRHIEPEAPGLGLVNAVCAPRG
jgi:hypothetical protein